MTRWSLGGALAAALASSLLPGRLTAQPADSPEIRAVWVDAFHAGIRTPAEAADLVEAARRANLNTIFVQVRRRGDALYASSIEPPLDDSGWDPGFDALAHIVAVAHQAGLKVHAWINAMPVWRDDTPPRDARHVFNRHGPSAIGRDRWLTAAPDGTLRFPVGFFLDPGHPGAAAHLASIYLDVATRYDVDGIHFDYIRYPEAEDRLPRGSGVGYNAVAIERFQRATGRRDVPGPGDEAFMTWRRRQVSALVRRVYLEAKAVKPALVVSAAAIAWGRPPSDEASFAEVAPMQLVFQDWQGWLREGILDMAVPMNYARETDATVRGWFDGWVAFEKRHRHRRHIAVGLGAYRNTPADTLAQVARVRAPAGGHRVDGVSLFSYAVPVLATPEALAPGAPRPDPPSLAIPPASLVTRYAFLAEGVEGTAAAFARPAPVPEMDWITHPTDGMLAGTIDAVAPADVDGRAVAYKRAGGFSWLRRARTVEADLNGFFGLARIAPGKYRVWVASASGSRREVVVAAGTVARVHLRLR